MVVNVSDAEARLGLEVGAQARLQAVLEIIHNLGRSLDAAVFLPNILDSLFEIFPQAERGYVLLVNPADGQLDSPGHQTSPWRSGKRPDVRADQPIGGQPGHDRRRGDPEQRCRQRRQRQYSGQRQFVDDDGPFDGAFAARRWGLLHLEATDRDRRFVRADLEVLWSVGTVTGQAVEFARVHEARLTFDRRQRELDTAREVQLHFLPHVRPEVPGYCFFDYYQAAEDVGGDYFGYIPLADGRLAIAVGDVSGKGVSAALLMARLVQRSARIAWRFARRGRGRGTSEPGTGEYDAERSIRDLFALRARPGRRHLLEVVNAGHPSPLRCRGQVVEKLGLEEAGPPLGLDLAQALCVVHHRNRRERHHRSVYRRHQRSPLAARHHLWLAPAGPPAGKRSE